MLTQEFLKEHFHYDPESGLFTVIKLTNGNRRSKIGSVVGSNHNCGYVSIRINKKLYLAHRLAWLYMYGCFPDKQLDHINGVRTDNRICNLRNADDSLNQQNRKKAQSNNKTSNLLGVNFEKHINKFRARIQYNGKQKHLGIFDTKEEAHEAYLNAKREFHVYCTI